jgi:hypothetical protein
MANPTQIANLALSWMGQNLINALGDNQNEAKIMNANYELSRDKVLEDYAWTFAQRREILSPVLPVPTFGEGNSFLIPSDVLRVHRVFRPTGSSISPTLQTHKLQNARWERLGNKIFAREEIVWAVFIIRVVDTGLFSPGFVHALAARLAADTAMTLTESERLATRMEERYDTKIGEAAYADGSQGRTEVIQSTKLTGTRTR